MTAGASTLDLPALRLRCATASCDALWHEVSALDEGSPWQLTQVGPTTWIVVHKRN